MALKIRAIEVMLSSRVDDPHSALPDGISLREVRERLGTDLMATLFTEDDLFSVFVNEASAARDAGKDIEQHCRSLIDRADVVLVLYNGSAGWAAQGLTGICHLELQVALDRAPQKVRVIALPLVSKPTRSDRAFRAYVEQQGPWMSPVAGTYDAVRDQCRLALRDAVGEMVHDRARMGSARFAAGRGEALTWRRLDFRERARVMRDHTVQALVDARDGHDAGSADVARLVQITYDDHALLLRVDAVPAAMTVPAAREMVGQPFLRDHLLAPQLAGGAAGPVHVIACFGGVTESQAIRQLGFPDATIVPTEFGVYAADEVQKVQLVLLAKCVDSTAISNNVQTLLSWLDSSAEGRRLAHRAEGRRQIVRLLSELQD